MTPDAPTDTAVAFARALRGAGLDVPVGSVTAYVEALDAVGVERTQNLYWAGRATLVRRPEDIPLYDQVFASFWLGQPVGASASEHERAVELGAASDDEQTDGGARTPEIAVRYSPRETLRHKDFASYSHAEFAEARKLMADVRLAGALRRSRRLRPSASDGSRPDVRRTVRAALRTGAGVSLETLSTQKLSTSCSRRISKSARPSSLMDASEASIPMKAMLASGSVESMRIRVLPVALNSLNSLARLESGERLAISLP